VRGGKRGERGKPVHFFSLGVNYSYSPVWSLDGRRGRGKKEKGHSVLSFFPFQTAHKKDGKREGKGKKEGVIRHSLVQLLTFPILHPGGRGEKGREKKGLEGRHFRPTYFLLS